MERTEDRLQVTTDRPAGDGDWAYVALLKVASTAGGVEGGQVVDRGRFRDATALDLRADLGLLDAWEGDAVCFAVGVEPPDGPVTWTAPACVDVDDQTEVIAITAPDGDSETSAGGGCSAGAAPSAAWLLALLGLGIRRRR